jgi:hypothetical protein
MNGTTIKSIAHELVPELALMVVVAIILAMLGPFGTWQAPFGRRLISWSVFALGGYACFRPVILAGDALAKQSALPRWLTIGMACLLASMPTTLIVAAVFSNFRLEALRASDLLNLYSQVLIVGATVTAVQLLLGHRVPSKQAPVAEEAPLASSAPIEPTSTSTLLDQLPLHLRRDILCLQNEDHYVRVHTSAGSVLLLMRLRDAVAQLAAVNGEQVHRSWWVARAAVRDVVRTDRRVMLRLTNELEIPVARSAIPMLRERGWLA